jgi:single-stranded DNA-specific DHH superfamily exonuclease
MSWFDIIKVLGTKSGYAQLDFDNIVEEDEENCKQRWLKYAEELRKVRKELARTMQKEIQVEGDRGTYGIIRFNERWEKGFSLIDTIYDSRLIRLNKIPEEVICKALDGLTNKIYPEIKMGDFRIKSSIYKKKIEKNSEEWVWEAGRTVEIRILEGNIYLRAELGFRFSIQNKDEEYITDLYDKLSEALK